MTPFQNHPSTSREPLRLPVVIVVIVALLLLAWGLEVLLA